jgi:hypothetical protein
MDALTFLEDAGPVYTSEAGSVKESSSRVLVQFAVGQALDRFGRQTKV